MAKFYPDHYERLKVAPTEGELLLLKKLEWLSDDHEIYFNPFLNHYRPDVVIVRKWFWVRIIEVKDWNLDLYKIINVSNWALSLNQKASIPKKSPVEQVLKYKYALLNVYLYEKVHPSVISAGVFFSHGSATDIEHIETAQSSAFESLDAAWKKRFQPFKAVRLYGKDADVEEFRIKGCDKNFTNEIYAEFIRYLRPNEFIKAQINSIEFTDRQKELMVSRGWFTKIRWPAWCGKTSVLAARANNAHVRHGWGVLVLTFNITLRSHIFQQIANFKGNLDAIAVTNYHNFIKPHIPGNELSDYDNFYDLQIPQESRFDSILIDEIQDYEWNWIRNIRENFLKQGWELVVFADEKQNIYDRTLEQDKGVKTGIAGNWNLLDNKSFRLWSKLWDFAIEFQKTFLNGKYHVDSTYAENARIELENSSISTWNVTGTEDIFNIYLKTISFFWSHPDDVSFISTDLEASRKLAYYFERQGIQSIAAFERYQLIQEIKKNTGASDIVINNLDRDAKARFRPHPWKMKFSTVHSFKGWWSETTYLLIWKWFWDKSGDDELIYTWLTRAKKNLVILNIGDNKYSEFFKEHSNFKA